MTAAVVVALNAVLDSLDGWIAGARDNHEGMGHRGEMDPCWEQFGPGDIRRMVADAAREIGLDTYAKDLEKRITKGWDR